MTLKRTIKLLKEYLKMNNLNAAELRDVNKYRLDEINKIRDYFNNEIKEKEDIITNILLIFTKIINEANIYENIKENIKELIIEPSSLERTTL